MGFTTAAGLVHEMMEARDERRLLNLQKQLSRLNLLIIDELGFVPLSRTGAELLFEVFSQRYERGSILVTTNLPFDEWTEVFGSERLTGALLDRLTHHVHILEMNGESYRLKRSRETAVSQGSRRSRGRIAHPDAVSSRSQNSGYSTCLRPSVIGQVVHDSGAPVAQFLGAIDKGLDQDALHATHVNQVHLQSPAARRIEALGGVALTQVKEFVALPDLGPWEGPVKQAVGEDGYCRAQLRRAALDPLRRPESVGTQLGRIVLGVSGSATARLTRVDLDQASPLVDAHQLEAQPDLHLLSRRAQGRRHRVEGVLAGHVVVGMHLGVAPVGDFVGLAVPGMQGLSFLI